MRLKEKALSYTLNARLLGLVLAIVLGVGGTLSLHGSASADPGVLGLDLSGSNNDGGSVTVNLDPVTQLTGDVTGSAGTDANIDVNATLDNVTTDISGTVDNLTGNVSTVDGATTDNNANVTADNGSVDVGATSNTDVNAAADTSGDTNNTILQPVTDLLGGTDSTGTVLAPVTDVVAGNNTSGGLIDTDDNSGLIDLGPNQDGGLIDVDDFTSGGGVIDTSSTNASDDGATDDANTGNTNNTILQPVTDVLDGSNTGPTVDPVTNIVGQGTLPDLSNLDATVDSVESTADPAIDPLIDACAGIPSTGVTVDVGSTCGGGDGPLDPVLSTISPITDPLVNVCLTSGFDAEVGTDCDGSGENNSNLLNGAIGDGGILPSLDTPQVDLQDIGQTAQDTIDPLDVCLTSDPLNLNQELGAGCAQAPAPCTLLNVNCLVPEVLNPVIGPDGVLDPFVDTCLGYGPLGANLDIGSACLATETPPPPTCPPDCGTTCPPDCGTTCPPDCGTTCPPDCGTTCPPDCGTTCPPDCGTTCPPFCGPQCPPYCVICVTFCGTVNPESPTNTNGATGTDGTGTGAGGRGTTFVPVLFPSTAHPPAAPLTRTGNFVPPTAGDGGLLGMSQEHSATPVGWQFFLLLILGTGTVVRFGRRAS